jgi:hypothetical protein
MVAGDADGTLEPTVALAPVAVAAEMSGWAVSRAAGSTEGEVGVPVWRGAPWGWGCAAVVRFAADRVLLVSDNPLG